jgi:hypothetical protein
MVDSSSSYTVAHLIRELRELKRLEETLPPIVDDDNRHDAAVELGVNVYLRRRKLRERPDVRRFMGHYLAAQLGRDDDPVAIESFVLKVWQKQCPDRDPRDFGEVRLDEFCELIENCVERPDTPEQVTTHWRLEAGGFWFDDRFYSLPVRSLALLRVFIESPRCQTFGYADLRAAWGDELTDKTAIRSKLSHLRGVLRKVAADACFNCDDPLPGKDGVWRFTLPR